MQTNLLQLTGVDLVVPVKGFEGAKSYPLGPSCRAPLFDDKDDILYIKTTDANGFPSIKAYEFKEIVLVDENSPTAVSLNDIRALIREELGMVKEELINAQQPVSTNNSTNTQSNVGNNAPTNKHNGYATKSGSKPNQSKQQGTNSSSLEFNKE